MATGKLIFGNRKIISKLEEVHGGKDILLLRFVECYEELRASCPGGDLHIYLYVEADSTAEVGAVFEDEKES